MKKKLIVLELFICIVAFCTAKERHQSFIKLFFKDQNYKTDVYYFDNTEIFFSYVYADDSTDIITKGIFYSYIENEFKKILVIENEKIYNDSKILFQGIIKTQQFYGYKIRISEKTKSIVTDFYTNKGKNVTEGPTFIWDSKEQSFYKYEIDPSEY